jgi:DNA-binding transcriptional MocR family regulator
MTGQQFRPEDLGAIEKKMREIINRRERAQRRAIMLERLADLIGALCLFAIPVAGLFIVWWLL